jgi:hypothetical protein
MQKEKFDRVAYRKRYDRTYYKKTVQCPRCGETKVKHMLARHMRTRKCRGHQDLAELDLDFGEPGADAFVGPHVPLDFVAFDVCSAVYAVCSYCLVPFKILLSWFDC